MNTNEFDSITDVLNKLKAKLTVGEKMLKSSNMDKVRLELDHFLSSLGNYVVLIEQEVSILKKKNSQLEAGSANLQRLYDEYYDKYLMIQKETQRQISTIQSKNVKLSKHNDYLSFLNRGIRSELEEAKRYINEFKQGSTREMRKMMKTVEIDLKQGTSRVCRKLNDFDMMWQKWRTTPIFDSYKSQVPEKNENKMLNDVWPTPKKKQKSNNSKLTQKKKSIEKKLVQLLQEQVRTCQKSENKFVIF